MRKYVLRIFAFALSVILLASCSAGSVPAATRTDSSSGDESGTGMERYSMVYYDYFDTVSTILGYGTDPDEFTEMCDKIEEKLSLYHRYYDIYHTYDGITNIRTLNLYAKDGPVEVSQEIIDLLLFCREMYDVTGGMTNVAMGSVLSIWHEYREAGTDDPENAEVPPMEELEKAALHCSIDDIVIDEENMTVYFADPELKIDVGAVAKGYTAERIAQYLASGGYDMVAVNLGGNIRTVGGKADGSAWSAGIQNPDIVSDQKYLVNVGVKDLALVTSGTYQRYYYVGDVKYHHIIHPDTLMPCMTFDSVSILTDDSGVADALSTACFNLSLEDGMNLISSLPDTEAMWVASDGEIYYSDGFEQYITQYY